MIDIFREKNLGGNRAARCAKRIEFLDQQLAERSRQLEEAEQRGWRSKPSIPT